MIISLSLRILSLICIGVQSAILDWYLVYYGESKAWLSWIAMDVIVIGVFIWSYLYADLYFQQNQFEKLRPNSPTGTMELRNSIRDRSLRRRHTIDDTAAAREEKMELGRRDADRDEGVDVDDLINWKNMEENIRVANLKVGKVRTKYKLGALPLVYVSWTLYGLVLVAKLLVIFLTFGETLNAHLIWGANMLELAFASTSIIFALVVSGHKKVPKETHQKPVIRWMQSHVMLDILDSVEILECLYKHGAEGEQESHSESAASTHGDLVQTTQNPHAHVGIEQSVQRAILAFVAIQILAPSVGLYQLSATNFAHGRAPAYFTVIQQMISMLFGNVPFFIIRIYLLTKKQFTESAFIFMIKNFYGIVTNMYEFIHWLGLVKEGQKEGKPIGEIYACEEE